MKLSWDRVIGGPPRRQEPQAPLDLLSLTAGCAIVAAMFMVVIWVITNYSLDWAFFR